MYFKAGKKNWKMIIVSGYTSYLLDSCSSHDKVRHFIFFHYFCAIFIASYLKSVSIQITHEFLPLEVLIEPTY